MKFHIDAAIIPKKNMDCKLKRIMGKIIKKRHNPYKISDNKRAKRVAIKKQKGIHALLK